MPLKATGLGRKRPAGALLIGASAGAAVMFFLDPSRGRRRRAMMLDQLVHGRRVLGRASRITARDLAYRFQGILAETKARLAWRRHPGEVPDAVLEARIRARLGRLVAHPHALEVGVNSGRVSLSGPVFYHEIPGLLDRISKIHGVQEIDNQLEGHALADGVPSLQGNAKPRQERPEFLQTRWSPTARLIAASVGAFLLQTRALPFTIAGALALLRSSSNHSLRKLLGIGPYRFINLRKVIQIQAPIERVFEYFSNYENFPSLFGDVREVTDLGDGRSHWAIRGPVGIPVEWTSVVSRFEPGRLIAWRSEPGSMIRTAGSILFDQEENGATRVEFALSYNPPAGEIGDFFAKALGASPRRKLNRDLMIMKSKIEGITKEVAA